MQHFLIFSQDEEHPLDYAYKNYLKIFNETGLSNRIIQIFILIKTVCVVWLMAKGIYLYCKARHLRRPKEIIIFVLALGCGLCILIYEALIGFVGALYSLLIVSSISSTVVWLDLLQKNVKSHGYQRD